MSLFIQHVSPEYIDKMLNKPSSIRYRIPHLLERAKQDLLWNDTLAYQRTMQEVARLERIVAEQDAMTENVLEERSKKDKTKAPRQG